MNLLHLCLCALLLLTGCDALRHTERSYSLTYFNKEGDAIAATVKLTPIPDVPPLKMPPPLYPVLPDLPPDPRVLATK